MAYITAYQYYTNGGVAPTNANWGSYQYVSLKDIVNNFMLMYQGDDKLLNNVSKHLVLFHAKRGIQELNYDALRSIKVLELSVCHDLKFILPPDYVNYVRISLEVGGILYPLHENSQVNYATAYLQDNNCEVLFDIDGDVLEAQESELVKARIEGVSLQQYLLAGPNYGRWGWCLDGCWYFGYGVGGYFGLNTAEANVNPFL